MTIECISEDQNFKLSCLGFRVTYTISGGGGGVPYYTYGIMGPETLFWSAMQISRETLREISYPSPNSRLLVCAGSLDFRRQGTGSWATRL